MIIRLITEEPLLLQCAAMMAATDPWITLGVDAIAAYASLTAVPHTIFAALENGTAAGFIALQESGAFTGYIKALCVAAEFRGTGTGRRLMEHAEEYLLPRKKNVFLCVSDFNHSARAFYTALGYVPVGELPGYLKEGSSEIIMRKTTGPLLG